MYSKVGRCYISEWLCYMYINWLVSVSATKVLIYLHLKFAAIAINNTTCAFTTGVTATPMPPTPWGNTTPDRIFFQQIPKHQKWTGYLWVPQGTAHICMWDQTSWSRMFRVIYIANVVFKIRYNPHWYVTQESYETISETTHNGINIREYYC